MFDKYPNVCVDITPGVELFENLSKNKDTARAFFTKYSTRILYGTDIEVYKSRFGISLKEQDTLDRHNLCHDFLTKEKVFIKGDEKSLLGKEDLVLNGLELNQEVVDNIEYNNFLRRTPKMNEVNIEEVLKELDREKERMIKLEKYNGIPQPYDKIEFYKNFFNSILNNNNQSLKILFIGNSHTYVHDMPNLFKIQAWEKYQIKCHVTMIAHPGWTLEKHLQNPEVRFNILYGEYDYIICQEYAHPFGPIEKLNEGMKLIKAFINQTTSKMVIYPTWAPKNNPPSVQEIMTNAHQNIKNILEKEGLNKVLLAPVDINWVDWMKTNPNIDLYSTDGEHPSFDGSLLISSTILDTIINDLNK